MPPVQGARKGSRLGGNVVSTYVLSDDGLSVTCSDRDTWIRLNEALCEVTDEHPRHAIVSEGARSRVIGLGPARKRDIGNEALRDEAKRLLARTLLDL
jgi:hypothetical protein